MRQPCWLAWPEVFISANIRLRYEILTAERLALIGLRNDGVISDEVLHRLEHELDVEALRSGMGELRVSAGNRGS